MPPFAASSISENVPWQNSIPLCGESTISISRLYAPNDLNSCGMPPSCSTGGSHGCIPHRTPASSATGVMIRIQSSSRSHISSSVCDLPCVLGIFSAAS